MSAHRLRTGDIVDITIRGARVPARHGDPTGHWIQINGEDYYLPLHDSVTVERVAPPEWPPCPGDLWRDKHGELWFIHRNPMNPGSGLLMGRTTNGARWTDYANHLLKDNAPLTLVHREPEGGAS